MKMKNKTQTTATKNPQQTKSCSPSVATGMPKNFDPLPKFLSFSKTYKPQREINT